MTNISYKVEIIGMDNMGGEVIVFAGSFDSEQDAREKVEAFFKDKDDLIKYKNRELDELTVKIFIPETILTTFMYPTI